jgi:excisionase family DNA binding protein
MSANAFDLVFTRRQAARHLGISLSTLKRLISEERLAYYRTGKRKTVISYRHIKDYLESVERPVSKPLPELAKE